MHQLLYSKTIPHFQLSYHQSSVTNTLVLLLELFPFLFLVFVKFMNPFPIFTQKWLHVRSSKNKITLSPIVKRLPVLRPMWLSIWSSLPRELRGEKTLFQKLCQVCFSALETLFCLILPTKIPSFFAYFPGPEFIRIVREHCSSTFYHHQLDRCQRDSFTIMSSGLREKFLVIQMDYAENIKLILRQQRYALCGIPCILVYHLFDWTWVPSAYVSSQADYFQTQQVALLIMCAQYLHPRTGEKCHVTYGFLSDDASHSSVSLCEFPFFPTRHICQIWHSYRFMNQDFVHHCTEQVYLEINNLYRRFRSRIEHVHLWSDNCASQFKCCHTFGWASKFRQTHKLFSLVSFFF